MFKNYRLVTSFLGVIALLFSMQLFAQTIPRDDPEKMVDALSQILITTINERREELEADPESVKQFANEFVLPYVDTKKMARYVMGKFWRTSSVQQQKAFMDAFSNTLIRSYSKSLLKLQIEGVSVNPAKAVKPGRVTVSSVVTQTDGNKTDVVYRAYLNKNTQFWMLYDVSIEGISMLLNYRKAYGSDFSRKGIDAVISDMQKKNSVVNKDA